MVDVGGKPATARRAVAEGVVVLSATAARLVRANAIAKGDVLATARLAGVSAAKRTGELIPLCHPLRLDRVEVTARLVGRRVLLRAEASAFDRTGVEMEALTAVAVASLTVYDMVKAVDRSAEVLSLRLLEKSGGKSGPWKRGGRARA
jgi:cyclic pyranopterin monophosphate synthase